MVPEVYRLYVIGSDFPPGLNTMTPATDLQPNETPDGFGYDLTLPGRLAKGTVPSGTLRVERIVNPAKAWAATFAYSIGDIVYVSALTTRYVCHTAHTSGATFAATNWITMDADYSDYLWTTGKAYIVGDVMVRDNPLLRYVCLTAHTAASFVADSAYWQAIGGTYGAWSQPVAYVVGTTIVATLSGSDPKEYVCKIAHTSANPFAETNWITVTKDYVWASGNKYAVGNMVVVSGVRYACKTVHTAAAAFATDAANWVAVTTSTPPCSWFYNRLWNITGKTVSTGSANISYGAPLYDDVFLEQKLGVLPCSEDSNYVLVLVPFGSDSMFVGKSTGSFALTNCADSRALFGKNDLVQELPVDYASHVVELDGVVYAANTNGLFSTKGAEVTEITKKNRTLTSTLSLASQSLMCDYDAKWIIGGTAFVYDVANDKLFSYVDKNALGTGFLYTTPQKHLPDYAPFKVDRFIITIEHGDATNGSLKYQVKFEDEAWGPEAIMDIPYSEDNYSVIDESLAESREVRKFQLRITDITGSKYIKEIRLDQSAFDFDSYSM